MKRIPLTVLLSLLFFAAAPAFAATPITVDIANKYFENCVRGAQKEATMTPETQQRFCACTALNMQKSMTQEDLAKLNYQNEESRQVLNKILIHVNGPCMEYPVHDLIMKKCMTDLKNPSICACLSTSMSNFTAQQTRQMMPRLLAENPNLFDPLTPIMESPEFQETQQRIALSCATNPAKR